MYSRFFILFAMIVVGYYGYRKGWLTREVNKGMGGLVMQATIPAMMVTTIANIQITHDILLGFFLMMAAQAAAMMIFGFLMRLYGKARKLDGRLLDMLDITTGSLNNGFIGLPVATIFFGDVGVMYMSAGVLGLNLYLWSYGVYVLGGKQGGSGAQMGKTFLKGAVNPNCIAIFLGLALTLSHTVHFVPQALLDFLTRLGDLSTPLSLIYIGALAGSSGIKQLFHEKDALEISIVKMLAMPFLAWAVMLIVPAGDMAKSIFLVTAALPSAVVVPMMVEKYGYGEKMSSDIVLLTTLISVLELPACVWLTHFLY